MPRGRSKDPTLPLTRQLTAQRDYRARKAARLQGLQEQVDRLTAENEALVAELTSLRAKLGNPERLTAAQEAAVDAARAELIQALYRLDSVHPPPANNSYVSRPPNGDANGHATFHANGHSGGYASSHDGSIANGHPSSDMHGRMAGAPSFNGNMVSIGTPQHNRQYAVSMSPSTSISTTGGTPPPRAMPVFDPNCCDGLFDCSALPGPPVSDMRTQGSAPFVVTHPEPPSTQGNVKPEEQCCLGLVDCAPTVQ